MLLEATPFSGPDSREIWSGRGQWPAKWVSISDGSTPTVAGYRLSIHAAEPLTARIHVSGDERYELYLNGERLGGGPERGDINSWAAETFDIELDPGDHILAARVFTLGEGAAFAQMTLRHGFLLCGEEEAHRDVFNTGHANWVGALLPGFSFVPAEECWGTGVFTQIDGAEYPWGWETATDRLDWQPARHDGPATGQTGTSESGPTRLLRAAILPAQFEEFHSGGQVRGVFEHPGLETAGMPIELANNVESEQRKWQAILQGQPAEIPANTTRRILIDLENYVCGMPILSTSGGAGAKIKIQFIESLFTGPRTVDKGNRDEVDGKYFHQMWSFRESVGDVYLPGGNDHETFQPLWWNAGRYVQLLIQTSDQTLTINQFGIREHRYPLENEALFQFDDSKLEQVVPIMHRTLQMCSHETYMDCPFYEQLQYVGDTRLQALITYVTSTDDRLPRQALNAFDLSRQVTGLTQSRYPSRVTQLIPPFSLWYVAMVHDLALWRGDLDFVRTLMVGVRGVLDHYRNLVNKDGLLTAADGWNFLDWVPEWKSGVPPDGMLGISAPLNLQFALVLRLAAKLENWLEEPLLAQRAERLADTLTAAVFKHFYIESRGLIADDLAHSHFSEHAQCLAILEGTGPNLDRLSQGLLEAEDLSKTTIYFTHYLFETYAKLGRTDKILERMSLWFWHIENGMKTTLEMPEPSRSDCHAWAAHPLYHYVASFAGYTPLTPGGKTFRLKPNFGPLNTAAVKFITSQGPLRIEQTPKEFKVSVPTGASGTIEFDGQSIPVESGDYRFQRGNP